MRDDTVSYLHLQPKAPAFAARLAAIPADAIGYRLNAWVGSVILITH
jgi:hypothetical protein